jgi:hypothetical protein
MLLVASLASLACNTPKAAEPVAPASSVEKPPAPATAASATVSSLSTDAPSVGVAGGAARFGAPIAPAGEVVSLADIARNPGAYRGKTVVTTGTVNAVCQERGCWMELQDGSKAADANVRMHGHAFFMPKSSKGKKARVQGTVVLVKDGKECDEMESTGAKLELDATGVELL